MLVEICKRAGDMAQRPITRDATPTEAVVEDLLARWMENVVGSCDWCGEYVEDEELREVDCDFDAGVSTMLCPPCFSEWKVQHPKRDPIVR